MYRQQPINPDVLAVGRAVVDLYPLQDGLAPKDVGSYAQYLGGSPTNVAVAAARAGLASALMTRTGDDLFHEFVVDQLRTFGVDTRWVRPASDRRTTLAVADLRDPSSPALQFFRDARPPESDIHPGELLAAAATTRMLWLTASGFGAGPTGAAHEAVLDLDVPTVLDLDYRPGFWSDEPAFTERLGGVLGRVDTVIGNEQECSLALGSGGSPAELAQRMLEHGPSLAIVKRGAQGAVAATAAGILEQPAFETSVVNGLGAGDAFGGFVAKGLLDGWPLARTLRHACAAGSIVASRRGCSVAMPSADEVAAIAA